MLKNCINETATKNIPLKETKSKQSIPWFNRSIKLLIAKRNRMHALFKKTKSKRLETKWKEIRNKVRKEVDKAHGSYVNDLIGDIKQDSKPFWKYINSQKADKQGIPTLVTKDNKSAETDAQKAEALNDQFTSVFTKTEYESVPLEKDQTKEMPAITITVKGVEKILKGINPSKAKGPDNIHPRVLKELASELAPTLAQFFQQSVDIGIIPDEWKKANICPLFKKKRQNGPSKLQACLADLHSLQNIGTHYLLQPHAAL